MFKSISLPPPELASAAYLKMAQLGDQPSEQAGGERELRLVYPPQAYNKHPQQKAKGNWFQDSQELVQRFPASTRIGTATFEHKLAHMSCQT